MNLVDIIENAFADRSMPNRVVRDGSPETTEYTDAKALEGRNWRTVTSAELQTFSDVVFGFSPEAFCYFLPGLMCAGIRENEPDLLVNSSIVDMLDRGAPPSSWDRFFCDRWAQLSPKECEAVQHWVLWLSEQSDSTISGDSLSRAFDTLDLLVHQHKATPLASR